MDGFGSHPAFTTSQNAGSIPRKSPSRPHTSEPKQRTFEALGRSATEGAAHVRCSGSARQWISRLLASSGSRMAAAADAPSMSFIAGWSRTCGMIKLRPLSIMAVWRCAKRSQPSASQSHKHIRSDLQVCRIPLGPFPGLTVLGDHHRKTNFVPVRKISLSIFGCSLSRRFLLTSCSRSSHFHFHCSMGCR